jgi:hypothetical protein
MQLAFTVGAVAAEASRKGSGFGWCGGRGAAAHGCAVEEKRSGDARVRVEEWHSVVKKKRNPRRSVEKRTKIRFSKC